MSEENPCLICGACCAYFRVSFYWGESNEAPGGFVPAKLTEQVHRHLLCMKGTNNHPPRCAALRGEIGKQVSCAIYQQHPTPCREFNEYELDGSLNMRCVKLRGISQPHLSACYNPRHDALRLHRHRSRCCHRCVAALGAGFVVQSHSS